MTQSLAYWIGGLLLLGLACDLALFGTTHVIFIGKVHLALLDWTAFWH